MDVGFYYMANAGGRLLGTLLSGLVFEIAGFDGCLLTSAALVLASALIGSSYPVVTPCLSTSRFLHRTDG